MAKLLTFGGRFDSGYLYQLNCIEMRQGTVNQVMTTSTEVGLVAMGCGETVSIAHKGGHSPLPLALPANRGGWR